MPLPHYAGCHAISLMPPLRFHYYYAIIIFRFAIIMPLPLYDYYYAIITDITLITPLPFRFHYATLMPLR
jgi:hypothetical protein